MRATCQALAPLPLPDKYTALKNLDIDLDIDNEDDDTDLPENEDRDQDQDQAQSLDADKQVSVSDQDNDEAEDPDVSIIDEEKEPEDEPANIILNFENTSLANIVDYLAKQKGVSYIPHPDLKSANITLNTRKPITLSHAWDVLFTLLEVNGLTMINVDGVHRIGKASENGRSPLPVYSSATGTQPGDLPDTDQVVRYVYFLNNIKSDQASTILNSMFTDKSSIEIIKGLDIIIIKEKCLNIKAAMQIVQELDQSGLRQSIKIIKLKYNDPTNVANLFTKDIFGSQHLNKDIRFLSPNKKEASYFSSNVRIIADVSRHGLILMGQEKDIDKIIEFIQKFVDKPMENADSRIHIYEVKNVRPDQLQRLLINAIKPPQGVAREQLGDFKFFEDVVISAETAQEGDTALGVGNRLIIACGKEDWIRLQKIIAKVDRPKPQIALEVMVVDINTDTVKQLAAQLRQQNLGNVLGSSFAFEAANAKGSATTTGRENSMLTRFFNGNSTNVGDVGGTTLAIGGPENTWAVLQSILTKSNTNIISQPFIVVGNNEPCIISTGETRIKPGEMSLEGNSPAGTRKQTPLDANNTVKITPRINGQGIIDLKIDINFADFAVASDTSADQTRKTRDIDTRVSMGSGEVIALGGLGRTVQSETVSRTPILSKIPFIGNLFRGKNKESTKINLYVFIRPSIIKPQYSGAADDYTQFKIDYAKLQIQKVNSYANSKDPVELGFFQPDNHSVKETLKDFRENKFHYIDDFTESKYQPQSANIKVDPFYQGHEVIAKHRKERAAIKKRAKERQVHYATTHPQSGVDTPSSKKVSSHYPEKTETLVKKRKAPRDHDKSF